MELQTHEQRMLELSRVQLEYARQRDKSIQARLEGDREQARNPKLEMQQPSSARGNSLVTSKDFVQQAAKVQTFVPSAAQKRFNSVQNRALSYLEPKREALGAAYDLALMVVFAALLRNPSANPKAHLTILIPRWVIARAIGLSDRHIDDLLCPTATHAGALEEIMAHEGWKGSLPVKTKPTSDQKPRKKSRAVFGGTLFAVRLEHCQNRLGFTTDDYQYPWRNLEADKYNNRTQKTFDAQNPREKMRPGRKKKIASSSKPIQGKLQFIYDYFNPETVLKLGTGNGNDGAISRGYKLLAVWDAFEAEIITCSDGGAAWVEHLAASITAATGDESSLGVWLKAAWVVVKCDVLGLRMARAVMYQALWDAFVASGDNPLIKSRAALARSIMNKNGWAQWVNAANNMV